MFNGPPTAFLTRSSNEMPSQMTFQEHVKGLFAPMIALWAIFFVKKRKGLYIIITHVRHKVLEWDKVPCISLDKLEQIKKTLSLFSSRFFFVVPND